MRNRPGSLQILQRSPFGMKDTGVSLSEIRMSLRGLTSASSLNGTHGVLFLIDRRLSSCSNMDVVSNPTFPRFPRLSNENVGITR